MCYVTRPNKLGNFSYAFDSNSRSSVFYNTLQFTAGMLVLMIIILLWFIFVCTLASCLPGTSGLPKIRSSVSTSKDLDGMRRNLNVRLRTASFDESDYDIIRAVDASQKRVMRQ